MWVKLSGIIGLDPFSKVPHTRLLLALPLYFSPQVV
jgi:hypothetical protein